MEFWADGFDKNHDVLVRALSSHSLALVLRVVVSLRRICPSSFGPSLVYKMYSSPGFCIVSA